MGFFSPNFEWLVIALLAAILATCCVKPVVEDEPEKKPFVLEE